MGHRLKWVCIKNAIDEASPQHERCRVWLEEQLNGAADDGARGSARRARSPSSPHGRPRPDARLAALALEHGLTVCSADTDFARFTEIEWLNPVVE